MRTSSRYDVRLTLQFLPIVASVRWKLWRMPFSQLHQQWRALVQRELDGATPTPIGPFSSPPTPEERKLINEVWNCAHAVRRAARLVPRGSCLTQAMALQLVLARRGQPCSVRIGVDRGSASSTAPKNEGAVGATSSAHALSADTGRFEAHAWVEWQGRVVLGGNITRWKPLTVFAPATLSRIQTPSPHEIT